MATITYTCDNEDADGNQDGRITIKTEHGIAEAKWVYDGGMGGDTELLSNTTEYSDEYIGELCESADICQGVGTFEADLELDEYGRLELANVVWPGDEESEEEDAE